VPTPKLIDPKGLWQQDDDSLDRDVDLQWFSEIHTGVSVYGRTSGTASNHIHLHRYGSGVDSGLNLDPRTGIIARDGNLLGDVLATAVVGLEGVIGSVIGSGIAAVNAAKRLTAPSGEEIDLTGLVFAPPHP
jgi:hypothetical protein